MVSLILKVDDQPCQYFHEPFDSVKQNDIQHLFYQANVIVGFNLKFDLHWARNYGIDFAHARCWDVQLGEFILSNQRETYPSLNDTAIRYGLGTKLDAVSEYWERGVDTPDIPQEILKEYGIQDVELTYQAYLKQLERFNTTDKYRMNLMRVQCADLLVLQEMEYQGMYFDQKKAQQYSEQAGVKLNELRDNILGGYHALPINLASGDHLSAFLYGGKIVVPDKIPNGVWKTGARAGTVRYKHVEYTYDFPRMIEPPEGSELKKEGLFSTDETTLRTAKKSKEAKKVVEGLLEYAKLDKLKSTYYDGFNKLITEMDWKVDKIHGQFNQCVARTGRLSSSRPNQQNLAAEAKELFYSRYDYES